MPRDYSSAARKWMVDAQLATNSIENGALRGLFVTTPREVFVPEIFSRTAYVDDALPLGSGRFLIAPLALATMIQALELRASDHVLIVGGNMGYSAAIIGQMVKHVVLADEARFVNAIGEKLIYAGCRNVTCVEGLAKGSSLHAPYDAILIEGTIDVVPEEIIVQLRETGRVVYGTSVTGKATTTLGEATITLAEKQSGVLAARRVGEASLPRLPGFERTEGFVFR